MDLTKAPEKQGIETADKGPTIVGKLEVKGNQITIGFAIKDVSELRTNKSGVKFACVKYSAVGAVKAGCINVTLLI